MRFDSQDLIQLGIITLASGRVAYSLTQDDIFRPLRGWIWMRSAPEHQVIVEHGEDGDVSRPARMYHLRNMSRDVSAGQDLNEYRFCPDMQMRRPRPLGKLFECVYCMSFWTSLLGFLAWLAAPQLASLAALPLAVWALANSFAAKGL